MNAKVTALSMHRNADMPPKPIHILILPLLYQCNCRCVMCNVWRKGVKGPVLDVRDLRRVINENDLLHCVRAVNVTGGEPTLHREFRAIMETLLSLPCIETLTVQTNGLDCDHITRELEFLAEAICARKPRNRDVHLDITVSMDGSSEIHDEIRGVKGAWTSALQTAREAARIVSRLASGAVSFNCTVLRQNVGYLDDVVAIAVANGTPVTFTVPQITNIYMQNFQQSEMFCISESEKSILLAFIKRMAAEPHRMVQMSPRYCQMLTNLIQGNPRGWHCGLFENGLFLEPSGNAYPCWQSSDLLLGNVYTDSPSEIMNRHLDPGFLTRLRTFCERCPSNCYFEWRRNAFARRITEKPIDE